MEIYRKLYLNSTEKLALLDRIHDPEVIKGRLVQFVKTLEVVEAVEGEDGEVLGHVDGGKQLEDTPRPHDPLLATSSLPGLRAQSRVSARNGLHVEELEITDPASAVAAPSPVRVGLDHIDDVSTPEPQSLSVIRVRREVRDSLP